MAQPLSLEDCPVMLTASIIAGKWKPLILHHLALGPQRYGELKRLIQGISKKMLTQQIRQLESDEIVHRKVSAGPLSVEYALTQHGEALRPVLDAMAQWAIAYRTAQAAERLDVSIAVVV